MTLPSSLSSPIAHLDPDLALRKREEKLDAALSRDATQLGLSYPNSPIHSLPDDARKGYKVLKYVRWCTPLAPAPDPKTAIRASFHYNLHARQHIYAIARLRFSNLPLRSETGRLSNLPRSQRTCTLCTTDTTEDEYHLLTCPTLQPIRDLPEFSQLITHWSLTSPATSNSDAKINHMFNPPPSLWRSLASLLTRSLSLREETLRACIP